MGCFLIGFTDQHSRPLLGSVSDDPYDVRTFLRQVRPKGKLAYIGTELVSTTEHTLEERGYFARKKETTRGINEAGLAFTCAMIFEKEGLAKPENPTAFADITEYIMGRCKTVSEAIAAFANHKEIHPAYSVLLADAAGDLAHIEVGNFGMSVYDRYSAENPGVVLAVNCYLSEPLISYNSALSLIIDKNNNNRTRMERGQELVEMFEGQLDIEAMKKILSDHENSDRDPRENPLLPAWGFSICNHGTRKSESYSKEDLPWGTVSAEILDPAERLFWYAYGWPCGSKPGYGDQIYQENSWGEFRSFGFKEGGELMLLTTPEGKIPGY